MRFVVKYKKNGKEGKVIIDALNASTAKRKFFGKIKSRQKYKNYAIVSIYTAWDFSQVFYGPERIRQVRR